MGDGTVLDGFTVTEGDLYGVYGKDAHFTIENCKVIDNPQWGIYAKDGDVIVRWCGIAGNGWHGVHHVGMGYSIAVEKTKVVDNQQHGILCEDSIPVIKNCVVFGNGYDEYGFSGINILRSSSTPTLYNNTVIGNRKEGISFVSPDPNYASGADYIDMQNCVVWYNNSGGSQVSGLNPDATAYYCCIQDCNDVPGRYNISVEPGFAYLTEPNNIPDPNNPYHLGWDSPCKDAGNPAFGELEVGLYDIDGEDRICYGRIDIGADEAYSCNGYSDDDIYNALDWNADGIVNFSEFAQISAAWGSRSPDDPTLPGDPNFVDPNDFTGWNGKCDFDSDYNIGLGDLAYFAYDGYWLWTACWKQAQMSRFDSIMSMMSGGESAPAVLAATTSIGLSGEPVSTETSLDPASIPTRELGSFVTGIREVIDQIETTITEGHENTENLLEMKVFLEDVLREIEAAAK
jgi:parallel beta-helix repeat protein